MALVSRFCPVLGTRVTVVTDLEGQVVQVVCQHHHRDTDTCRLKARATTGGPLSELLERAERGGFADRTVRCQFG
jgi:hypothetical protein